MGRISEALPTEAEILEWWSKWPDANIGIVTALFQALQLLIWMTLKKQKSLG